MNDLAPDGVTRLLIELSEGDERAVDKLLPLVYDELRKLAGYHMKKERAAHTLQPTALVHETYLKLIDQQKCDWKNRAHFFALASQVMRRLLVNHARDRKALKRGGADRQQVSLSVAVNSFNKEELDILALNEALEDLSRIDERKGRIVELKFFGGLSTKEIAEILGISVATVERDWSFAKAWLYDAISSK